MTPNTSPDSARVEASRQLALRLRRRSLEMIHRARSSHVGSALSMADLLAVLYGGVLRVKPDEPKWPERDRFVLSKGHACAALYAVLAEVGFFPEEELKTFYKDASRLAGHATTSAPGIEVSTGSLGHGLPVACGMALAGQRDGAAYRVVAMLSDGECDEGSNWEAALFAAHHRLDNLVVVIDYNKIQSLGNVADIMALEPLADKWRAFNWGVVEVDGHDIAALDAALHHLPATAGRPTCVIAHTIKGKGVPFMEHRLAYHYQPPTDDELARALAALEGA